MDYINKIIKHIRRNYQEQNNPKGNCGNKLYKIQFKTAEQIYIKEHNCIDITNKDEVIDCHVDNKGIGLKTFIIGKGQKSKSQKIGEFGKNIKIYNNLDGIDLCVAIANMYNERLKYAINKFNLQKNKYHCLIIDQYACELIINEYPFTTIDVHNIRINRKLCKAIGFTDGSADFSFYLPKSVLSRKFSIDRDPSKVFDIDNFKNEIFCPHCNGLLTDVL